VRLRPSLKERGKYTIYGALFGAAFPLISWLILTFVSRDSAFLFIVICSAPLFLGAFARFAGVRQDRLDAVNRKLEARVEERTRSIKSLLDVSGQGFLSFDDAFLIGPEYSRECERIFGGPVEGRRIDELLYPGTQGLADFRHGMGLYFKGSAKSEVIFDLLDRSVALGEKTLRVEYRAVDPGRVMAIFTDITEEQRRERQSAEENERRALLLGVIANRRAFNLMDREASELFPALLEPSEGYEGILRDLHTFKGNLGFLGFRKTQAAAHALEDFLSDRISLGLEIEPAEQIEALSKAFVEEREVIIEALGKEWLRKSEVIEITRRDYLRIEDYVRTRHPGDAKLLQALEAPRMTPLSALFDRFPHMAEDLALRMGKRIAPLVVRGGDMAVLPDEYEPLVASCAHILRNMIDHGIEAPSAREASGKASTGQIGIDITEAAGKIAIAFSDDGGGIRFDEVERRGRELRLVAGDESPPAEKLLQLIFRDGFSTRSQVSSISGRGVGLASVREELRRMGGRINVNTKRGAGTVFTLTLPRRTHEEARA
jgi:two-component system, chemotaxis family, sensor kinase CheA